LPAPAWSEAGQGEALIVADPTEDLASARTEGRRVADQLPETWSTRRLEGREATGPALRRYLPQADLFHYAGHGRFAGRGGWESALPLAGDSRLTVADILALERAPRHVVLSACETAKSTPGGQVESVTGLAHAFLTAGSRSVVAAVRPVEDRTAATLVRHYYAAWSKGAPPPEALRQAQLELRRHDPAADWASFRLLEP
ncbi:MAG: CHAT domain-containing protein, partial [Acidobacteriota bacterium]